jgi:hypothetical protein
MIIPSHRFEDTRRDFMAEETRRTFVKKIGAASALAAGSFLSWNPRPLAFIEDILMH